MELLQERVDEFSSVSIRLASPDEIRSWSYGEVKKPETINYRTYRAEKDGLFCERIFGPERDWECFCGKYKGMKHKGIICDRCGVKVAHSRERRKRMGHINLAAPVAHIWFFKAMPSRMATILGIRTSALERVVYFQDYIVIDPGKAAADGIEAGQLLSEDEYRKLLEKYGDTFEAGMGAEAIKKMLQRLDLSKIAAELRAELQETKSQQRIKEIIKRLKLVEAVKDSPNKPEWMIFDVIPVIPPDLRPLVMLESGNFATSDLNDLYRRVINRNNRLKKLLDLHAPEVIIRNEKRMLQQAVDALFDNERCKRSVIGASNRPLKSLTDMIKGKQGRFRENLLGKRVDYSARSVIVVGPELKLHQCGLPKKIALELYQPFIIRRLKDLGYVDTIRSAKKMLERRSEEVWDILDEVIREHPVLLNRAPTLHRMSIQAFQPVLIEGNAIRIHPLVCEAFNADFDGDQMAVHLPLSIEAQAEATVLMLSTNNIFSPADGRPIITPSLDIVLGCFFLTVTKDAPVDRSKLRAFADTQEVLLALDDKSVKLHDWILLRIDPNRTVVTAEGRGPARVTRIVTTPGRVIFNDILPEGMPFYNLSLNKEQVNGIVANCHALLGRPATIKLLDDIKALGFHWATRAGVSFSVEDLKIPADKHEIIARAQKEVDKVEANFRKGIITDSERYNQVIAIWTHATNELADKVIEGLKKDVHGDLFNPIYLMHAAGTKGGVEQLKQMAGMRGLMSKPSGRIIETPIKACFREGLPSLEYFSSTHGGRKGLADTALKTAESGYLTRKLADVAQNIVIRGHDCGTTNGVIKTVVYRGVKVEVPLSKAIRGRVSLETVTDRRTGEVIVREGELITMEQARRIEALGYDRLRVRSPMTCELPSGICARCYGMDLSTGALVEEGMAVGIIAAQCIGEPGTQLTMRTFHYGGVAARALEESEARAPAKGIVRYSNLQVVDREGTLVVLNSGGDLILEDKDGNRIAEFEMRIGAELAVRDGEEVEARKVLATWDPNLTSILAEKAGFVRFEEVVENETMRIEEDAAGHKRKVIIEHKGDLHPQVLIVDEKGEILDIHSLPEKAHIAVEESQKVIPGSVLAKTPREIGRSADIVAGLPRVTELFEARRPKDPAIISEISGYVELGERKRGKRTIIVRDPDSNIQREHLVPQGKHLVVRRGDHVSEGDRLVDGPLVPQDILRIKGEEAVQQYLLDEIQRVYRSQKVSIDDKHIEIIISQMLRKVRVSQDTGDTNFLPGAIVDKFQFRQENERVLKARGRPASATPVLLGITKAALQSESFISAASFQETTKVLTEAALAGKVDVLSGLKENVILGHRIPAGTGYPKHLEGVVQKKGLPEVEPLRIPEPTTSEK